MKKGKYLDLLKKTKYTLNYKNNNNNNNNNNNKEQLKMLSACGIERQTYGVVRLSYRLS